MVYTRNATQRERKMYTLKVYRSGREVYTIRMESFDAARENAIEHAKSGYEYYVVVLSSYLFCSYNRDGSTILTVSGHNAKSESALEIIRRIPSYCSVNLKGY